MLGKAREDLDVSVEFAQSAKGGAAPTRGGKVGVYNNICISRDKLMFPLR